jgi:hypothetical protein
VEAYWALDLMVPLDVSYGSLKRASSDYQCAHDALLGEHGPLAGWISSKDLHLDEFAADLNLT